MYEEANILADKMAQMAATGESFEHIHMLSMANFATSLRTICHVDMEIQQNFHHEHPVISALDYENKRAMERLRKPWLYLRESLNLIPEREMKNRNMGRSFAEHIIDRVKEKVLRRKEVTLADKKENSTQANSMSKEFFNNVPERSIQSEQPKSNQFPGKLSNGNSRQSDNPKTNNHPENEVVFSGGTSAKGHLDSGSREAQSVIEKILKDQLNPDISKEYVMSYYDLVTEMVFVVTASIDTTKTTTAMMMIMLGLHPDIQQQVYDEILTVLGDDPTITPTYHQLQDLHILTRVIKETLRLHPPAHLMARQSDQEITVAGVTIPKGVGMYVVIHGVHHDPHYWGPTADQFIPDRFLPSSTQTKDSAINEFGQKAFLPFSTGPRNCFGYKFAMLNMKLTMVALLRRFRILPGDKCRKLEDIRCEFGVTMEFVHDANDIRLEPRY